MMPLAHALATVIKLHGDYAGPQLRIREKSWRSIQSRWNALLARVFDEYGLLVVGWSAECNC
jgi:hypothetical protein